MDSDQEMNDAEMPHFPSFAKGKGKAQGEVYENDNLPWCAASFIHRSLDLIHSRVEKYRPVTLNDVVSHKDITSTSESRISAQTEWRC